MGAPVTPARGQSRNRTRVYRSGKGYGMAKNAADSARQSCGRNTAKR